MNKKGQSANSLPQIGMAFLMIGIIAAIGVYVLDTIGTDPTMSTQTENSSIVCVNDTWVALPYRAASISKVSNNGDGLVADNETVAWCEGCGNGGYVTTEASYYTRIKVYTNGTYREGDTQTVLYEAYSTPAAMAAQNTSAGIAAIAAWLPLIGLVIAAGIIIAILTGAFGGV